MKKLDWYILKKFLTTFFFSIFLFTVIAVIVDVSEKTDDFVKSQLSFTQIVMQYYIGFIPHIVALLFPLFVFIAVIFFTSKMAGKSEIIAILASGTNYNRWLRPYWVGGILLSGLLLYANLYVIPQANEIHRTFKVKYIDNNSSYEQLVAKKGRDIYLKVDSFSYAGIKGCDDRYQNGGPFFMNTIKGQKVVKSIRSERIAYDSVKKNWLLTNVVERDITGIKEKVTLEPNRLMKFNFKPRDLKKDGYIQDKLTSPELARFIELEELRGAEGLNELKVELYRRISTPVTVLMLTLIGAIVAGRKVRGGSGSHLAVGFITAAAFIVTDRFSTIFSTKGNLPPMVAVWIPNFIFLFVAYYMYRKAPK